MTARPNLPEFSVSEVSLALKRTVEEGFEHIRVRGEISGFKRHSSGHLYFCLKDSDAVLDACCWRAQAQRLGLEPQDGMEVVATGRLTTYPGRSKYQMVVERMELAGQGALLKLLEDRKRKLAAEGLFDAERKRPIPFLPRVIGVVTSPTGAVIRDILHRLGDRFPRHVLLWPVAVQGEGAAAQVAAAIAGFNAIAPDGPVPRPDVLIVARGGGSLEDLWAFNEEIVVRAAAASQIPLISAVGHETDTTLIDYASDRRAPTPTGAAEMAVPVRLDLVRQVSDSGSRLVNGLARGLEERRLRLLALGHRLPDLRRLLDDGRQRLEDRSERLGNALPNLLHRRAAELHRLAARLVSPREQILARRHLLDQTALRLDHVARAVVARRQAEFHRSADRLSRRRIDEQTARGAHDLAALSGRLAAALPRLLEEKRSRLEQLGALLNSYSHERVLDRGFALVVDEAGQPVMRAAGAKPGAAWTVRFADDKVAVTVSGHAPAAKPRKKPAESPKQGSLF